MAKILIVEDESQMRRGLQDNLAFEGYDVDTADDGAGALEKIMTGSYDLVILDVMLPALSGTDVCRKVREAGIATPIIMLTAKGEEIDKVLGLELGADDYVTKPFGLRELLARVRALLRRAKGSADGRSSRMVLGTLEVDFEAYTASRSGAPLAMTPREFELLKYLWQYRNKTVSRDNLLTEVWGYDASISTRTIDNFILKMRQKIEEDPAHPKLILTIHGVGYKLIA